MSQLDRILEERKLKNENLSKRTKASSPVVYGILIEFRADFGDGVSIGWSDENGTTYGIKPKDRSVQFSDSNAQKVKVKRRSR